MVYTKILLHVPERKVLNLANMKNCPIKKHDIPGVAILNEEDWDPPHHCPRCDIYWNYNDLIKS